MKIYQLIGKNKDGEDWDYAPLFKSKEDAELQKNIEIAAYTYNGVCNWDFKIKTLEVEIN